jgi:rhodanese-related sulfurtransferase
LQPPIRLPAPAALGKDCACAGGYRSSIAVSILNQHGITNPMELAGGITALEAAKLPVVNG